MGLGQALDSPLLCLSQIYPIIPSTLSCIYVSQDKIESSRQAILQGSLSTMTNFLIYELPINSQNTV